MSGTEVQRRERLLDLLAARATQALERSDCGELAALLAEFPDISEDLFDVAAAAIDRALCPPACEPLPPALRARLEAAAHALFSSRVS